MVGDIVVTGILVTSAADHLIKWTKCLFFLQLGYFIYRMLVEPHWVVGLTFVMFGIYLPFFGYRSATTQKSSLYTYACLQCCLSILAIFGVINMITYLLVLSNGCDHCSELFRHGNVTCQYRWGNGHVSPVHLSECEKVGFMQIVWPIFFMTSISGASCCAAFAAHRILYDKHVVAQIIHTVPSIGDSTSVAIVDDSVPSTDDSTSVASVDDSVPSIDEDTSVSTVDDSVAGMVPIWYQCQNF